MSERPDAVLVDNTKMLTKDVLLLIMGKLPPRQWFRLRQVERRFQNFPYPWTELGAKSEEDFVHRVSVLKPDLREQVLNGEITLTEGWEKNEFAIQELVEWWREQSSRYGRSERFIQQVVASGFLSEEEAQVLQECDGVHHSFLPFVLKRYYLPHSRLNPQSYNNHRYRFMTEARAAIITLFDEGLFQVPWIAASKTGKYFTYILRSKKEKTIGEIVDAIRDGLITHEYLATSENWVTKFVLSPMGLETLRKQWLTLDEIRGAKDSDSLLRTYLIHKYDTRLAELNQNGVLPTPYVAKLHPQILKIFLKNPTERWNKETKCLLQALESGYFTLDDLVTCADHTIIVNLMSQYKDLVKVIEVFNFVDAMKIKNPEMLDAILRYLTPALLAKTINKSDVFLLVNCPLFDWRKNAAQAFLPALMTPDCQAALRDGSITIKQITSLKSLDALSELVQDPSRRESVLANNMIPIKQHENVENPPTNNVNAGKSLSLAGIRDEYEAAYINQYGKDKIGFFKLPIKRLFKQKTRDTEIDFLTAVEAYCNEAPDLSNDQKYQFKFAAAKLVSLKIESETFGKGSQLAVILRSRIEDCDDRTMLDLIDKLLESDIDVPTHLENFFRQEFPKTDLPQPLK